MKLKASAEAPLWWGVIRNDEDLVYRCQHPHRDKREATKCAQDKIKNLQKRGKARGSKD